MSGETRRSKSETTSPNRASPNRAFTPAATSLPAAGERAGLLVGVLVLLAALLGVLLVRYSSEPASDAETNSTARLDELSARLDELEARHASLQTSYADMHGHVSGLVDCVAELSETSDHQTMVLRRLTEIVSEDR